ncbi:MAG TPA: sulfite exporter TauE/SafE family protein, partial [Hyphomicrobium sp.]|nr:sulfite exporter TauE/SafE family protein [Hyphomicrobium sp.]
MMLLGGLAGTYLGVSAVRILRRAGYFDFTVTIMYVIFLGVVGTIILVEGINASRHVSAAGAAAARKSG